jgi:hypothetical protein
LISRREFTELFSNRSLKLSGFSVAWRVRGIGQCPAEISESGQLKASQNRARLDPRGTSNVIQKDIPSQASLGKEILRNGQNSYRS